MRCYYCPGIIILFSILVGRTQPQPSIEIDSAELLIGDQRIVNLSVLAPEGHVDTVLLTSWRSIQPLEMLGISPWDTIEMNGGLELKKKYRITLFDTGYILLPPLEVIINEKGNFDTLLTNDLALTVRGIKVDSLGLAPIKYIIREPHRLSDYWIPILAFFLAVIGFIIWKLYRKQIRTQVEVVEPAIPPHEIALRKLKELEKEKLWQQGYFKRYQSELTFIIREYLEKRYQILALEMTTSEILMELRKFDIAPEELRELDKILNIADLVKFAKAQPELDLHQQFLLKARDFIHSTTYIETEDKLMD